MKHILETLAQDFTGKVLIVCLAVAIASLIFLVLGNLMISIVDILR